MSLRPLIAALAVASTAACAPARLSPPVPRAAVSQEALRKGLGAFAHDSMMGREAGTSWNEKASDYVASQFRAAGVEPGGEGGTYFQTVPRVVSRDPSAPPGSARNVIGVIRGSDSALRGEFVAITAHNDHIGYNHRPVDHDSLRAFNAIVRPLGADSPNRPAFTEEATRIRRILDSLRAVHTPRLDSISNGADDDGSGTIALIEIAHALASADVRPRR
ncbi:MAG TPA: M28 family peptidase, partial [Gemmatimonadaceae bacterium]|nr:M28 family peptidase [Gemmatimonadaceae bacterium]